MSICIPSNVVLGCHDMHGRKAVTQSRRSREAGWSADRVRNAVTANRRQSKGDTIEGGGYTN